ncbi:condensin complex subunit 2 [Microplitis demolitor]|uniref:condensin complex subunit 2 n=1 Tax=Microplitis demolitor TaxID=69319 RepID=UPI0004CD68EC|nr:condensin complex subunit 2 [Microplitis demolitor]
MDNRKSFGHVLADNATASPLRRRSGFVVKPSSIEIETNDDTAERQALRTESSVQAFPSSTNRRSIRLGAVSNMSTPQITEGMAECIKLSAQNKINIKNAFSLNMIDYMTYMVRNKSEGIPNLHMAGTTLDVSAKIYALRVDALHQDTLKMIGNLDTKDRKNNDDNDDSNADRSMSGGGETNEENGKPKKKKKKKKGSQKILTTIEALQGKVDVVDYTPVMFGEGDCQTTNMLYQASLPQHCDLGLGLNPFNDVIIDNDVDELGADNDESRLPWPPVKADSNLDINSIFSQFEILHWSIEQEDQALNMPSQESFSQDDDNLVFDPDASIPLDDDAQNFNDVNYFAADENDNENENEVGCHATNQAPYVVADLQNIIERMPMNKKLEYSYFSDAVDIRWIGPTHWKISKLTNNMTKNKLEACQQNPKRKKKDPTIQFDDGIIEIADKECTQVKKNLANLKNSTVSRCWSIKKLLNPKEIDEEDNKALCKYYLRSDQTIFLKEKSNNDMLVLSDDNEEYNYDNGNDTENYCPNVQNDDAVFNDCAFDDESRAVGFTGNNLIEAPKLTQKIYIPFSQRAKKLDVRHLKKCIWESLTKKDEIDKENAQNIESSTTIKEQKRFSEIYTKLPNMLSKNDAEELSFPIAFVSLLHLANEKNLNITSGENYSDIIIQQHTN